MLVFLFLCSKFSEMMTDTKIQVTPVETSKLNEINLENLAFGKYFSDYMLEADYENGVWTNVEIKPYQPLLMSPATAALHYGQAIFEGIKAYKDQQGNTRIFRPYDNFLRFNISAQRMQMPEVPEYIFMDGLRQLIALDSNWVPQMTDHSLYIRPFMYSNDPLLGVRPSDTYKFLIILSPTGPYYTAPMRLYVEDKYVRAVPGGVGYAKAAGNYGAAMYATDQAKQKGYDQVLWTDAFEHKYIQECGAMNVFFIIGNTAVTPDLGQGTILAGITRNSVMTMLTDMGLTVEERAISIDELIAEYEAGNLKECFGTGTAATITLIKELGYRDMAIKFDVDSLKIAATIKKQLSDIREGNATDKHGWMLPV